MLNNKNNNNIDNNKSLITLNQMCNTQSKINKLQLKFSIRQTQGNLPVPTVTISEAAQQTNHRVWLVFIEDRAWDIIF